MRTAAQYPTLYNKNYQLVKLLKVLDVQQYSRDMIVLSYSDTYTVRFAVSLHVGASWQ